MIKLFFQSKRKTLLANDKFKNLEILKTVKYLQTLLSEKTENDLIIFLIFL